MWSQRGFQQGSVTDVGGMRDKSRPSPAAAANRLPSPTDRGRRRNCSAAATAGLGSAGNASSPVKVSVCTESRRGCRATCFFFFSFFLERSTCQQLYHYPKKENVFGSVGGPRLWKRTSHNDSRFIKATSVSACCASICLFHSGFFFSSNLFLN